jgi:hypothetical protein
MSKMITERSFKSLWHRKNLEGNHDLGRKTKQRNTSAREIRLGHTASTLETQQFSSSHSMPKFESRVLEHVKKRVAN